MALSIIPLPSSRFPKKSFADSSVIGPSSPAGVGTFDFAAANLAFPLSPKSSSIATLGPMKTIPSSWHLFANPGFSARNPYPGWIESAPDFLAIPTTCSISRYAATPSPFNPKDSSVD